MTTSILISGLASNITSDTVGHTTAGLRNKKGTFDCSFLLWLIVLILQMIDALACDKVQNLPIHLGIGRKQWDSLNREHVILGEGNSKAKEHTEGSKI